MVIIETSFFTGRISELLDDEEYAALQIALCTWPTISLRGGPMNKSDFQELVESVRDMDEIRCGKKKPGRIIRVPEPEVKSIREKAGLSQIHFAALIGVSKRTLENWEQGRRHPTGPARALLRIVDADPRGAIKALHG